MPDLIFLIGPMGVGKTTIGKLLSTELGFDFVDSDREIERRSGADISWIFDVEGEQGFRKREEAIIKELAQTSQKVIATGGGAILSQNTRKILANKGTTVYIDAPIEVLLERTCQDKSRPLLQVSDPKDALEKILNERTSLYIEASHFKLSSAELSSRQIVAEIVNRLT